MNMGLKQFTTSLIAALCFLLPPLVSQAAPVHTLHVDAELIAENKSIEPGEKFWVAIHLQMDDHWHTYWQNPGDSGLPTKIKWELPAGFSASEIQWPAPSRIVLPPLVNYGYSNEVFLLTEVTAPKTLSTGKDIPLTANVSWLVCREECIPGKAKLELSLPVLMQKPEPNSWSIGFSQARMHLPKILPTMAIAELQEHTILLQVATKDLPKFTKLDFFPADPQMINGLEPPKVKLFADHAELEFEKAEPFEKGQKMFSGILIVDTGKDIESYKVQTKLHGAAGMPVKDASPLDIGVLFLAFLGGLILNLMPCVFPVLGIKILGVVKQHGGHKKEVRRHGLYYAFGVLLSFWVLTGALLALRFAGQELGWGFQLQSPAFVAFMALLLFLIGMNLLGTFEFGDRFMGTGANLTQKDGVIGAFFTGILAVVIATPCTAPFMGTAIGVALSQPAPLALLTFTFLALGLAFPYVLLSYYPALLSFLPKPGAWMLRLKEFFAFPIFATVLWLLWVYSEQSGVNSAFVLLGALLLAALAIWIQDKFTGLGAKIFTGIAMLLILWLGFFCAPEFALSPSASTSAEKSEWSAYSENALDQALMAGHPVFVDFTAAWCLSCQVNERLVLSRQDVKDFFQKTGTVLLKGDWTNRDPSITRALDRLGRAGVPVYAYYSAKRGDEPKILPQILTKDAIVTALPTEGKN